jgi:hypothetical protein
MSEFLILLIIIVAVLVFFYKERIRIRLFPSKEKYQTIDDQFNAEKRVREQEIDRLLNKIGKNGVNDLSAKDRRRLDELSKK